MGLKRFKASHPARIFNDKALLSPQTDETKNGGKYHLSYKMRKALGRSDTSKKSISFDHFQRNQGKPKNYVKGEPLAPWTMRKGIGFIHAKQRGPKRKNLQRSPNATVDSIPLKHQRCQRHISKSTWWKSPACYHLTWS